MNFCIPFNKESTILKQCDEIIINYTPDQSELRLESFIQMWPDHKITLNIGTKVPTDELIAILQKLESYSNFSMRFSQNNTTMLDQAKKLNIPYYFNNIAYTYDDIYQFKGLGVSEVIIGPELGFDLINCSNVAKKLGLLVRSYHTYSILYNEYIQPHWQYFIRPEDMSLYEQYIDTIEFFSGDVYKINVLFNVYKEQKWDGSLNEIIFSESLKYDNKYIPPIWGRRRVKCGRSCMYKENGCHICEQLYNLSKTLEQAQIIIPSDERGAKTLEPIEEETTPKIKPNF